MRMLILNCWTLTLETTFIVCFTNDHIPRKCCALYTVFKFWPFIGFCLEVQPLTGAKSRQNIAILVVNGTITTTHKEREHDF